MSSGAASCEVLVVGAGPAGLAAAYRAARGGRRVAVVDDNPHPGGQIWRGEAGEPEKPEAAAWLEKVRAAGVRSRTRGCCWPKPPEACVS
jgi:D-hydroxyproline dehydrogenase subunit alpha